MSNVEFFLFIVKLNPTVNKKIICRNNDIPSPARKRLQESDILYYYADDSSALRQLIEMRSLGSH